MKIRNKNGRIHTAFSALDTLPGLRISDTFLSLFRSTINPLDKYCPDFLRRQIASLRRPGEATKILRRHPEVLAAFAASLEG
jgi:hypothetical protein